MAHAALLKEAYPKGVVEQVTRYRASGEIGAVLSDEAKAYLSGIQPIGHILFSDAVPVSVELPFGFNNNVFTKIMHVDGRQFPQVKLTLSAAEPSAAGIYVSVPRWEVWRIGAAVEIVANGDFAQGALTGDLTACDNWYDVSVCPQRLSTTIDLSALKTDESGVLAVRLVSGTNAKFTPIPIFRPLTTADKKRRVAVLYPDYTWQAYNVAYGGSIYITPKADLQYAVSLDRPNDERTLTAHHNFRGTLTVAREYERMGIPVSNILQSAFAEQSIDLSSYDTVTIVGHDEYWDAPYDAAIRAYLEDGGNLVSLSGNTGWWKIDRVGDVLGINKGEVKPDLDDAFGFGLNMSDTGLYLGRDPDLRIEGITGSTYESGGYAIRSYINPAQQDPYSIIDDVYYGSDALYVVDPKHSVFAKTGAKAGGQICIGTPVLDWELDGAPLSGPDFSINYQWLPTANRRAKNIASAYMYNANFPSWNGRAVTGQVHYSASLIETEYGSGRVLTLGSMGAYALIRNNDPRCAKMGQNILTHFLK